MIISEQYSLKDYAKPIHKMSEEQAVELAGKAEDLLNKAGDGHIYKTNVRISERQSRVYVDVRKDNNLEVTIEPTMMGDKVDTPELMANALLREIASREKSLGFIRGDFDGSVFENKFQPQGLEETYHPTLVDPGAVEEEEEDRSC